MPQFKKPSASRGTLSLLRAKTSKRFRGFTLVELIVVITILAILATVGFLALSGYTSDANKSAVVGNLRTVEKGLSTTATVSGKFPMPTGYVDVTYSGWVAWRQWTAGKSVMAVIGMGEPPKDPSGNSEFDYSLSANGMEFQVASAYLSSASSEGLAREASAAATDGTNVRVPSAAVSGNYNGLFVPVVSSGTNYLVAAPTIVLSNVTASNRELKTMSPMFLLDGKPGVPASWSGKVQWLSATGVSLNVSVPLFSSGASAFPKTASGIESLAAAVSAAYSGTAVASVTKIASALLSPSSTQSAVAGAGVNALGRDMAPAVATVSTFTYESGPAPAGCSAATQSGYTVPALSSGGSQTLSKTISNGTGSLSASCTNGVLSYGTESITCAANYVESAGSCVLGTCSGIFPTHAVINGSQGISSWQYDTNPWTCRFKCDTNYVWNSGNQQCVAATQVATCVGKPTYSSYNTATSITQTWNGSAWIPSATATYNATVGTTDCRFKCDTGYFWDWSAACVSATLSNLPNKTGMLTNLIAELGGANYVQCADVIDETTIRNSCGYSNILYLVRSPGYDFWIYYSSLPADFNTAWSWVSWNGFLFSSVWPNNVLQDNGTLQPMTYRQSNISTYRWRSIGALYLTSHLWCSNGNWSKWKDMLDRACTTYTWNSLPSESNVMIFKRNY